jgi:hypothetical protein
VIVFSAAVMREMKLESTVAAMLRAVDTNVLLWKVLETIGVASLDAVMSFAVRKNCGDIVLICFGLFGI